MKPQYICRWNDATNSSQNITRNRVAYLIRAARSRNDKVTKTAKGFDIGTMSIVIVSAYPQTIQLDEHVAWDTMFGETLCGFVTYLGNWKHYVRTPSGVALVETSRLRPASYEDTIRMSEFYTSIGK